MTTLYGKGLFFHAFLFYHKIADNDVSDGIRKKRYKKGVWQPFRELCFLNTNHFSPFSFQKFLIVCYIAIIKLENKPLKFVRDVTNSYFSFIFITEQFFIMILWVHASVV